MTGVPARAVVPLTGSLIDQLQRHAEKRTDQNAIVTPTLTLSWAQLLNLVALQAQALAAEGVDESSVLGIHCSDDVRHLLLCLSGTWLGAASVAIPSHESRAAQQALAERCGVTKRIGDAIAIDLQADVAPSDSPTAAGAELLFATSGTTGTPKIVRHSDSGIVAQAHRHIESADERFACLASVEHNFAKRHRLYCIAMGATGIFPDTDNESLVAQCSALRVNTLHVSAFQAQELLAAPGIEQLAGIRLKLGGSHVGEPLRRELRARISDYLQAGYGTTETGAIAFTDPDDHGAGESVGRPLPGIEVRAVSPERRPLGPDEHGELAVRSAGMFLGYLGNSQLTDKKLADGWFYTGDVGCIDRDGRIYVSGRCDDMFVFNSMNIYPQDIESELRQCPVVADVAVVAQPSKVHENIPVALVVFTGDARRQLPVLEKFARKRLAVRCPRLFVAAQEIPRNAAGKVLRQEAAGLPATTERVRAVVADTLRRHRPGQMSAEMIAAFADSSADFAVRRIGLDSLARMELLIALEVNFDVIMTPQDFSSHNTLGDLVAGTVARIGRDFDTCEPAAMQPANVALATTPGGEPTVVRLFQRVFRSCDSVGRLHKALDTFGYRITPQELADLQTWNLQRRLLPAGAARKFQVATDNWLQRVSGLVASAGKSAPEPYAQQRLSPAIRLYRGPGQPANKTLVICFANHGGRSLMMPNPVLLQHADAGRFDLLIVAEPFNRGYRHGLPHFGRSLDEMLDALAQNEQVRAYNRIRTLGCSAGCHPAIAAGYRLGAELAVSAGGRFHSWRHPLWIFDRAMTCWKAARHWQPAKVVLAYDSAKTRDRNYARVIAALTGATMLALEFSDGIVGHAVLAGLLERGELSAFLKRTAFAPAADTLVSGATTKLVMSLPADTLRPAA